ncbi:MAG: MFS transporter [Acidimicrobiia bacterium]|nr:MFS transporter [Acidimicrobiia bacterium]
MTASSAQDVPPPSPYRWVILVAAVIAQSSSAFVLLGIGALTAFFRDSYDLNGLRTGLIVTAIALGPLFGLIPVGRFLDHHSEGPIISGGALLMAAAAAGAAFVESYPLLLLVLFLGGTGYAAAQPGGAKVVSIWFPDEERGLAMGIRQTGLPLGGALAAAILPALADGSGLRVALLTAAAVAAVGGVLFYFVDRHPPVPPDRTGYRFRSEVRRALGQPEIRRVGWVGLAMVSSQFSMISYLILYLHDDVGMAVTTGAWVLFTTQMGGVVGRVVLAAWSDRVRRGRMVVITASVAATAPLVIVLAFVPADTSLAALIVLASFLGFFGFGWYGPWVVHVAEVAPGRAVGLSLGIAITGNQLGIVAAPPIFGLLLDISGGYLVPWLTVAAFLAAVAWRAGSGGWRWRRAVLSAS